MAFRYKVTKMVQVKQYEPLTVEAEYSTDKSLSLEGWNKVADRVESFVMERLKEQVSTYKGLEIKENERKQKKDPNVVDIPWED